MLKGPRVPSFGHFSKWLGLLWGVLAGPSPAPVLGVQRVHRSLEDMHIEDLTSAKDKMCKRSGQPVGQNLQAMSSRKPAKGVQPRDRKWTATGILRPR